MYSYTKIIAARWCVYRYVTPSRIKENELEYIEDRLRYNHCVAAAAI